MARRDGYSPGAPVHVPLGVDDDEPVFDPLAMRDLFVTNQISEVVERHYPGHPWMVSVSHAQGVAMIKLPALMGATNAYVVHISTLATDPGLRCIVRACGEILERYGIPRCGYDRSHFHDALESVPIHRRGMHGHVLA